MNFAHAWKKQLALPNVDLFVCTRCALLASIGAAGVRPASGSVAALKFVRAPDAELGEEPSCVPSESST